MKSSAMLETADILALPNSSLKKIVQIFNDANAKIIEKEIQEKIQDEQAATAAKTDKIKHEEF